MDHETKHDAALSAEVRTLRARVRELEAAQAPAAPASDSDRGPDYESLVEHSPDIIARFDPDLRHRYINRAISRYVDLAPADYIGKTNRELGFPAETTNLWDAKLRAAFETGEIQAYTFEYWDDEERFVFQNRITPEFGPDGAVVSALSVVRDVTAVVRAGEAVQRADTPSRRLIEHLPDIVYTYSTVDGATYWSPRVEEILGLKPEALQEDPFRWHDAIHPDDVEAVDRALAAGDPQRFTELEYRIRDVQGKWHWFLDRNIDVEPLDEGFLVTGMATDITERKQLEAELRSAQARLRSVFDAAPVGIGMVVGRELLYANDAICDLLGYARHELEGRHARILYPSDAEYERVGRIKLPQLMAEGVAAIETQYRTKDGRVLDIGLSSALIDRDDPDAGIISVALDLTARNRAEARLRRYRTAVEASNDLIIVVDRDYRFTLVNAQFLRYHGRDRKDVIGRTVPELVGNEVFTAQLKDPLDAALAGESVSFEFALTYPEIGERYLAVDYAPVYDAEGAITGVMSVIRDITEQHRAQDQLQEAQERMLQQERLAAVGQLSAGIAHDFRNLLTAIILEANLLVTNPRLPRSMAPNILTIISESNKAANLVQQLLDFSSRSMLHVEVLDLHDLVDNVVEILRRAIPETVQLSMSVQAGQRDDRAFSVRGDSGRLEQALMNLALNSRDAMPDGGRLRFGLSRLHVADPAAAPVAEMPAGDWVHLRVADTGTGMTKEVQAHLFEPFFSTKEVGKGTGLGLAQVYGIVRQHEGYIDVDTAPGEGTTFHIYLPLSRQPFESQAEPAPEDAAPHARGHGETVLLVEDSAVLRDVAAGILSSLDYVTLSAANGREALEIYDTAEQIDLIITDMTMPEMGGWALMREIRRRRPDLPAIGITGYALQDDAAALREAGFIEVIRKPFSIDALADAVRHALDGTL